MQGVSRILIVLLMLVALPLRGYAAELCPTRHGELPVSHASAHDQVAEHKHGSEAGNFGHADSASVCGQCTTCCVGASLAPDERALVAVAPTRATAIPFDGLAASGRVPDTLDRPPLPL